MNTAKRSSENTDFISSQKHHYAAIWPQDILHSSALLKIDGEALPPALRERTHYRSLEPGQWSLLTDRSSISTLLPYQKTIRIHIKVDSILGIQIPSTCPPLIKRRRFFSPCPRKVIYNYIKSEAVTKEDPSGLYSWLQVQKKPSVLFVGGVQGNNVHSIQNTFTLLEHFLKTKDGLIQLWKEKLDLWFIPILNVDGNHYFWYRNTHEGDVVPKDTNQDGYIDIGEGIQFSTIQNLSFHESPHQTRGTAPYSTPELHAISSLSSYFSFYFCLMEHESYSTSRRSLTKNMEHIL